MEPGKHTMRLTDWGVSSTQKGQPQAFAIFSSDAGNITWYGGTNAVKGIGKTMSQWDVTLKNLQTMGYAGPNEAMEACAALYDGPLGSIGLVMGPYDLTLIKDDYGVKVQYINKEGEGGGVGKKFASKAEMMAAFQQKATFP